MASTPKRDTPSYSWPVRLPAPVELASMSGPPIRVWPIKEDFPETTPGKTAEEYAEWRRNFMTFPVYLNDLPSEEVAKLCNRSRMQVYMEELLGAD